MNRKRVNFMQYFRLSHNVDISALDGCFSFTLPRSERIHLYCKIKEAWRDHLNVSVLNCPHCLIIIFAASLFLGQN